MRISMILLLEDFTHGIVHPPNPYPPSTLAIPSTSKPFIPPPSPSSLPLSLFFHPSPLPPHHLFHLLHPMYCFKYLLLSFSLSMAGSSCLRSCYFFSSHIYTSGESGYFIYSIINRKKLHVCFMDLSAALI